MKQRDLQTYKYLLITVLGVILVIGFTIMGQQSEKADDEIPLIELSSKNREKAHLVAIRRVNLIIEETGPEVVRHEKLVPHVEVEIYVGKTDLGANLAQLVLIGFREFGVYSWKPVDDYYNGILLLTAEEFEELTDGAEIVYRIGYRFPEGELKKLLDEGKIGEISGVKVGKLDKKMIDLEPTVEKRVGWKPPQ